MARLREIGAETPRVFELAGNTTLGRDAACSIVLQDPLVSRMHAEIRKTDAGFVLFDLGSTHGTFVNGAKIKETTLSDGLELLVGATRFRFEAPLARFQTGGFISEKVDQKPLARKQVQTGEFPATPQGDEDYQKLHAAYQLMRAIGTAEDLDAVLNGIADCAFRVLAADRVAVLLLENGTPKPRLARRRDGGNADDMVLSKSILNEVIGSKAGVLLLDAGRDVRFSEAKSVMQEGIRSAMCVPMVHQGELVGVMLLDSLMATNVFAERDLELFTSIAGQAALVVKNAVLRGRLQDEARTRVYLQRFLSPGVIDQVVGGKYQLGHGGELREISVLFSDIRGFTSMSETVADPQVIVGLLNDYFERMVDTLFRYRGTLDKYVGDALMALFGAPVPMADAAVAAVTCALEMQRMVDLFNQERAADGLFPIQIGIGVHTGLAVCGTIGSRKAMQYTAIGDTVNTCSRLCSVAKAGQVIISDETMRRVASVVQAEALEPVQVKGKAQPLHVYRVLSAQTSNATATMSNT